MSASSIDIQCWKCGAQLSGILLPFSRHEECAVCQQDLHACKGCKYYSPSLTSACNEDRADFFLEKDKANFCDFFTAHPSAYVGSDTKKEDEARAKLAELFGETSDHTTKPSDDVSATPVSEADKALAELKRLFGDE